MALSRVTAVRTQHPDGRTSPRGLASGNGSDRTLGKIATLGLTPAPATLVTPPRILECYANLECRVIDTRVVNHYNFVVLEVVNAWAARDSKAPRTLHHRGRGHFMVAGGDDTLPSK